MADEFCLKMPDCHVTFRELLHAVNLWCFFIFLPKEGVLRIFSPWKIQRLQPGLNPWTWVPKANTLPLDHLYRVRSSTANAAVAFEECGQLYLQRRISDRRPCTRVQQYLRDNGVFSVQTEISNVKYNAMWRNRKTLFKCCSEDHALLGEEFLPVSVFDAWKSEELHTETDCILKTSSAFSILN